MLLFVTFLIAHNTGVELSAGLFMLTAIGGFVITLLGGIGFAAWITTKPVQRDATHVVDGSVDRVKRLRNSPMRMDHVRFQSPTSGKNRKATFLVLPEQRGHIANGTMVAVGVPPLWASDETNDLTIEFNCVRPTKDLSHGRQT